jgi:hypothetical protein
VTYSDTDHGLPGTEDHQGETQARGSDSDKVVHKHDLRLRKNLEQKGDFSRIHPMPQSGQDVPYDLEVARG